MLNTTRKITKIEYGGLYNSIGCFPNDPKEITVKDNAIFFHRKDGKIRKISLNKNYKYVIATYEDNIVERIPIDSTLEEVMRETLT